MANASSSAVQERLDRPSRSRDAALKAAAELLTEIGSERFTIDAVIQRSGVARTTIYRHWPSRDALLAAVGGEVDGANPGRLAVLEAAATLLAERGAGAFTIDAVIERCGVARSTIYRHWPSRTELLKSVVTHLVGKPRSVPDTGSLRGDLLAHFLRSFEIIDHSDLDWRLKSLPTLIEISKGDPELVAVGGQIRDVMLDLILPMLERAAKREELRRDLPLRKCAQAIFAAIFTPYWLGEPPTESNLRQMLEILLNGMSAPREGLA